MQYHDDDLDWSDWHTGLSPERQERYEEVLAGIMEDLVEVLLACGEGHTIVAAVPEGLFATGAIGDRRCYTPVVTLFFEDLPDYDHLQRISSAISNHRMPVYRVNVCLTKRVIPVPALSQNLLVDDEYENARAELQRRGVL